jgi:hypothetical protein
MIKYPIEKVFPEVTRAQRVEYLRQYFLNVLFEDPHEGSIFEHDVLNAIKELQKKYPLPHALGRGE